MSIISSLDALAFMGESTPTTSQILAMDVVRPLAEDAIKAYVGYSIEQATHTHFLPDSDDRSGDLTGYDVLNNRVYEEREFGPLWLYLPERPVRSITNLYEDPAAEGGQGSGDFGAGTELTQGVDFYIDWTVNGVSWTGRIDRIVTNWSTKRRTIKVVYSAGLSSAELAGTSAVRGPVGGGVSAFRYAAFLTAALYYREAEGLASGGTGPIQSERLYDYAVTYAKDMIAQLSFQYRLPSKAQEVLWPFRRLSL